MKRGFTLLELVVVILIIGILATLGLTQYGRIIERSRGAEARAILGDIRKMGAGYYLEYGSLLAGPVGFNNNRAGIGPALDQIPSVCRTSHYFSYSIAIPLADILVVTATRCGLGGKIPVNAAATGNLLTLSVDYLAGTDTWDDPAVNPTPGAY